MRTALAAFIEETSAPPDEDAPPKRKRGRPATLVGERNEYLESLFERLPPPPAMMATMTAAVAPSSSAPPAEPIPAPVQSATIATSERLTQCIQKYYQTPHPLFSATEGHLVPRQATQVVHKGTDPQPGERIIQVTRYGRIYKRKSGWFKTHAIQSSAPPGTRYCRMCEAFMPLDAFYSHIRRYVCRVHHAERVHYKGKQPVLRDDATQRALEAWDALASVRPLLGYTHVNFDHQDIRSLLLHCGLPISMRIRLIPIDPSLPLRPRNVAFVSRESFDLIMRTYEQMCSRGLFMAQVQRCNLMPRHMDAGWPENPTHDPTYRRQDVDVGPILAEELARDTWDAPDSDQVADLIAMEREGRAPWVERYNHYKAVAIAFRLRFIQHVRKLDLATRKADAEAKKASKRKAEEGAESPPA